jgi:hypothetical protein
MKKMLALCLLVGLAWAFTRTDNDIIDDGITDLSVPHHVLPTSRQGTYLVDSSGNVFTSWTQRMECLSYNPTLDGLEFICRGYSPTGVLNISQSDGAFSFWVTDLAAYNQEIGPGGGARYPSSIASAGPNAGYPVLVPGASWGYMVGTYYSGGWWSSFYDAPVDLSGNVGAPRCVPKELPNGDIVHFADLTSTVRYETWSADLLTQRADGEFPITDVDYIGADCNGGICYCFLLDLNTFEIYYTSTTDGISWSTPTLWDITWPSPYTNNLIDFYQMAITDAGDPIIVFNIADNDAAVWPYGSKTYVQTASGATPIQVSDDTYTCSTWPTIATGGDLVAVLMHVWTNAETDSFARMDHCAAFSADNGANWTTPVNLTAAEQNRPGLGQIAKRLNATDGKIYFYYGVSLTQPGMDPDYWMYWTGGTGPALEPAAWYMAWDYVTGIEENKTDTPMLTTLNFAPNPTSRHAMVSYTLSKAGEVSLRIFDLAGREVQTVTRGYMNAGVYSLNVDTGNLANGTYFLVLDSPAGIVSRSLVVVH